MPAIPTPLFLVCYDYGLPYFSTKRQYYILHFVLKTYYWDTLFSTYSHTYDVLKQFFVANIVQHYLSKILFLTICNMINFHYNT